MNVVTNFVIGTKIIDVKSDEFRNNWNYSKYLIINEVDHLDTLDADDSMAKDTSVTTVVILAIALLVVLKYVV